MNISGMKLKKFMQNMNRLIMRGILLRKKNLAVTYYYQLNIITEKLDTLACTFKMAAKSGARMNFCKYGQMLFHTSSGANIQGLSLTVSQTNAFLHFMKKYKKV